LLSLLYEVLITFSLWLIILFKLDFPSYCLLLCVVGSVIADVTGKVGYRKHRIFLLMLSILANEGLRGFCCSLILSPDAALELTAHRCYIQAIAWWLWSDIVRSICGNVRLHHRREVDACLYLLLKRVLSGIAIWEYASAHNMHMIQDGISLKFFVAILCFGLPKHVQISIAIIDQFPLLVFSKISVRPQLSLDASLLFLICIIHNWQVPLLVRWVLLQISVTLCLSLLRSLPRSFVLLVVLAHLTWCFWLWAEEYLFSSELTLVLDVWIRVVALVDLFVCFHFERANSRTQGRRLLYFFIFYSLAHCLVHQLLGQSILSVLR